MPENTIPCWIFKSARKEEMYLYLAKEDSYDDLPEMLRQHFGKALFVMQLDLQPGRPLARAVRACPGGGRRPGRRAADRRGDAVGCPAATDQADGR